jgi:hypothetical protein
MWTSSKPTKSKGAQNQLSSSYRCADTNLDSGRQTDGNFLSLFFLHETNTFITNAIRQ